MDKIIQLGNFDIFIVEVSLGIDFEGHDSNIKLLTESREIALAKAKELSDNLTLNHHDYGFVEMFGGYFDSSMPPTRLFQSEMIQNDDNNWLRDQYIDEAAGGIDINGDACSESNNLALDMLKIERSLSQSKRIIGRFAALRVD